MTMATAALDCSRGPVRNRRPAMRAGRTGLNDRGPASSSVRPCGQHLRRPLTRLRPTADSHSTLGVGPGRASPSPLAPVPVTAFGWHGLGAAASVWGLATCGNSVADGIGDWTATRARRGTYKLESEFDGWKVSGSMSGDCKVRRVQPLFGPRIPRARPGQYGEKKRFRQCDVNVGMSQSANTCFEYYFI